MKQPKTTDTVVLAGLLGASHSPAVALVARLLEQGRKKPEEPVHPWLREALKGGPSPEVVGAMPFVEAIEEKP
jgi:hypothetical protein